NERHCELGNDKDAAQSLARASSRRAAATFLERVADATARSSPRRHESEDESGQDRNTECESKDATVDTDLCQARQVLRLERHQQARAPEREHHSRSAA